MNKKQQTLSLILTFFAFFLLSIVLLLLVENDIRETKIAELKQQEQRVVKLGAEFLGRELDIVLSDLQYLNHAYDAELIQADTDSTITQKWIIFSTHRRIYDQIRFIDALGYERISVNYQASGAVSALNTDLRDVSDQLYYLETIKLRQGRVYVSSLDLSVVDGHVLVPYIPMIRFSTPVYDELNTLVGMIIINVRAESILQEFRNIVDTSQGEVLLANAHGDRLSSKYRANDWNFMFPFRLRVSLQEELLGAWTTIVEGQDQFISDFGLITSTTIRLGESFHYEQMIMDDQSIILGDGQWYVVSIFNRVGLNQYYFRRDFWAFIVNAFTLNKLYLLIGTILSMCAAYFVNLIINSNLKTKYFSKFDGLTNTLNRRSGLTQLRTLIRKHERRNKVMSLCFIDIDGLKEVNDTLGHKHGDELIKTVSSVIKHIIRDEDFIVRLGGDEFLIVFDDMEAKIVNKIWARILQRFDEINSTEERPYIIRVSHGVQEVTSSNRSDVDELINRADEIMYQDKDRNQSLGSVLRNNT